MVQINVELLKSRLLNQKTTAARFEIPLTESELAESLEASYINEVEYRHRRYVADENMKKRFSEVARVIKSNDKFGILFCGQCGNGKTTMMYAIRNLFNLLSRSNGIEGEYSRKEIVVWDSSKIAMLAKDGDITQVATTPLLAIDDLGKEPGEIITYGNVVTPMVDLIEQRYKKQLFTIATTNLLPKQIGEKYGARIADRFNEMFHKVVFDNQTYRR